MPTRTLFQNRQSRQMILPLATHKWCRTDFRQVALTDEFAIFAAFNNMFRNDKPRSFRHNLRLASMLSLVAGVVNINGVLSLGTLTTNVTGHFAFFAEDFVEAKYDLAALFILYILSFLLGAFVCGVMVELVHKKRPSFAHAAPMFLEIAILTTIAWLEQSISSVSIASALLFAMGLQNALVTKISKARVRTTHLTGLFTDLGIEFAQLFFYRANAESKQLLRSISLRVTIIICFFLGCVAGGFLFHEYHLKALLFAVGWLLVAMVYDTILYSFHAYRRKLQAR